MALTNQSPVGQLGCGLGWMVMRESFMGQAVHATAAHTGFTGPIIAIVPERGYTWALLSNRTWPVRTTARHHTVSARISDALWYAGDAIDGVLDVYTQ
jgi:CubicO group peptidase (beta-lactamase class C family)